MAVEQEIAQRSQEFEFVKRRIVELQEARKGLLPLVQAEAEEELTESLPMLCLRVLLLAPNHGVSVPKIRESLKLMGVDVSGKNPLGILHTALGRLARNGLVAPIPTGTNAVNHFQITLAGMAALQQYQQAPLTGPALGGF
jgi:hypothetical protein